MRRAIAALSLAAVAAAVPVPARAQLRGVLNKAKEKLTPPQQQQQAPDGDALTDALVGKVLVGAQAADRVLADRDAVQRQRDAADKQLAAMRERNEATRNAYTAASTKVDQCRGGAIEAANDARRERLSARGAAVAKDPAAMVRMQAVSMKYTRELAAAQQRGDTAAMAKIQRDMTRELAGEDIMQGLAADSAAADAKCGKTVGKPAALADEDRLQKHIEALDDSVRTLEAQALITGAKAAGMDRVRYSALKERALTILTKLRYGAQGFGSEEVAAVQRRRADLEKVKRAL